MTRSGTNALGLKVGGWIEKADEVKTHKILVGFWVSRIDWN